MFEELKTFVAVVEHKNFTKAGEYLNLSQPSVSTHIKNLESYYGVTLINRSIKHKSIVITENGYKLYNRAKEILHILDTTYMEVRDISDSIKGIIKVGASLTIGEYILPGFLTIFRKKYPDIEVDLLIENTTLIAENLKDLTLDIGFIEGVSSYPNLNQEYLSEDKMVLAVPYDPHWINNKFTFNLLQNQNWVAREEGSGTRDGFQDILGFESEELTKEAQICDGSGNVKSTVEGNENAIAYISFGYVKDGIKSVKVDGVEANDDNVVAGKYPISRPFLVVNKKDSMTDEAKAFVDFIMSEDGQNIIAEEGFIKAPTK